MLHFSLKIHSVGIVEVRKQATCVLENLGENVEALVGTVRTTGLSAVSAAALNSDKPDSVHGFVGEAGE